MLNNCLKVQYIGSALRTEKYDVEKVVVKRLMSLLAQ
jgi:hypothetical protein